MSVVDQLLALLPRERVITDPAELFVYEFDGFTIARRRPAAVVFPISTARSRRGGRNCWLQHGVQIVPRGSGTGLAGGCVAFENGVVVSTVRMNRILQIDLDNRVAHVEAGVRNTRLSDAVAALPGGAAYHFAPDPSSQRASTIGGNAATNAGGHSHAQGFRLQQPRPGHRDGAGGRLGARRAAGRTAATKPGRSICPGLICGSEGTLGIITKLWVRLVPKATQLPHDGRDVRTTADACNAVSEVIAAGMLPAAMEMMDGAMVQAVEDAFHFGFPREAQALVLIEIDGIDELLDGADGARWSTSASGNHAAKRRALRATPRARAALWKARKSAFGRIGRISHSYCTQDACVPRSRLAEVLERIARDRPGVRAANPQRLPRRRREHSPDLPVRRCATKRRCRTRCAAAEKVLQILHRHRRHRHRRARRRRRKAAPDAVPVRPSDDGAVSAGQGGVRPERADQRRETDAQRQGAGTTAQAGAARAAVALPAQRTKRAMPMRSPSC